RAAQPRRAGTSDTAAHRCIELKTCCAQAIFPEPERRLCFGDMTVGFCPAFEPKLDVGFEGDGASLFHYAAILDAIAEENDLPLLSSFADDREPPPDFDGYPEDLAEALGPWTAWFSPTDGLRCVEGLLALLDDPEVRERIHSVDPVIADLEALEEVLIA